MKNHQFTMLDCLDPIQLGFIYESLMMFAQSSGLNSDAARDYLHHAIEVRDAISANCGFEDYVQTQQAFARKLATYDPAWQIPCDLPDQNEYIQAEKEGTL